MSTPVVYGIAGLLSFGGSAALVWNRLYDAWDDTAPYWNTDLTEPESALLLVAGVVLSFGLICKANQIIVDMQEGSREKFPFPKLANYAYGAAALFLLASASLAFADTFGETVEMDFSQADLRGARALQGIVGVISLFALVWNTAVIREWKSFSLKYLILSGFGLTNDATHAFEASSTKDIIKSNMYVK